MSRFLRFSSLLATSTLAALWSCGGQEAPAMPVVSDPHLQTVLSYIQGQMESCGIPGGAIAIVENGQFTELSEF